MFRASIRRGSALTGPGPIANEEYATFRTARSSTARHGAGVLLTSGWRCIDQVILAVSSTSHRPVADTAAGL